tara:strand:+ start:376 stop:501 length:126 start_codon:yes stop_codon:yes gene_type:complete
MVDESRESWRKGRAPRRTQPPYISIDQRRRVGVLIIVVLTN